MLEALPIEAEQAALRVARSLHRPGGAYERQDLEQEARLIAWEAVAQAQHRRNLRAYVSQRVRWRLASLYRDGDAGRATPASDTPCYEISVAHLADDDNPFDEAISRLDADGVLDWVGELTPLQRRVLLLYDIADFPIGEVAARLGLSIGAAKATRHRAVAQLRRRVT
jgi:RNA polymerase sigma factor (sigma-70 family)